MKLKRVRIEHFQCIANSGEIPIDDRLTILVGSNESGKSAILKALRAFNRGYNLERDDFSTLTLIRDQLASGSVAASDVPVVTLWLLLEEQDRPQTLALERFPVGNEIVVTKTLASTYRVQWPQQFARKQIVDTQQARFSALLRGLLARLRAAYKGRVKRKLPWDSFVFLERFQGEPNKDNLILFAEWAPGIWDRIQEGDWLQVTRLAEDPYARNTRALNAGFAVDTDQLIGHVVTLLSRVQSGRPFETESIGSLRTAMKEILPDHPIAEIVSLETLKDIEEFATAQGPQVAPSIGLDEATVFEILPEFVYVSELPEVSASIPLSLPAPREDSERLLESLLRLTGLDRQLVAKQQPYEQTRILEAKQKALGERLREYWVAPDLACELRVQGQRLYLYVDSQGSMEPPLRRSRGLSYYLAAYAQLSELAGRRNVIVLFDDPAQHMHPNAQRSFLRLLNSQPYQIMITTHSPFMVDLDRLEQVRPVVRNARGTQIVSEWRGIDEVLEPVWGRIVHEARGRDFLMVEGMNDVRAFSRLSRVCQGNGRPYIPEEITVFPGNGHQLPHLAGILHARGFKVLSITDGDTVGAHLRDAVRKLLKAKAETLDTLLDVASSVALEDLFSDPAEFLKATQPLEEAEAAYSAKTLDRFARIFEWIQNNWKS